MKNPPSPFFSECRMTSIGLLTVCETNGHITELSWGNHSSPSAPPSELTHLAFEQLEAYSQKRLQTFSLPIIFIKGTDFQKRIWQTLLQIPYGVTVSYSELAEMAGCPKAVRAVGMACHCNPISIIVPCHRVIGKNKKLTGYAGGLDVKRRLLDIESHSQPIQGCKDGQ